ncbi:MAG: LysR substrate-binding domain-containing protein [Pseudomonadota bacterium]
MMETHAVRRFIPSLSALVAFEAAATYGSFTRAGEDLGLSQSGVSRQVAVLERHLGVKLFERVGPRLILTDAGRSYAQEITPILNALETASINFVRGGGLQDTLRIGVQDSLGSQWLVRRLPDLARRAPKIDYTVLPVSDATALGAIDLDIAILRGRGAWADAHAHRLFAETVAVVAAPRLVTAGQDVPPQHYHRYPLIQNAHRPDSWLRWLEAKGLDRQDRIAGPRFAQTSMVIEAAISGLGLAIVPVVMIEDELANGRLRIVMGPPVPSGLSYFVVYPLARGLSKPVLDLRDWLLAETRPMRRSDPNAAE